MKPGSLLYPAFLLFTGTSLNIIGQYVTDTGFADPKSQLIPWVKFTASLFFAAIGKALAEKQGQVKPQPTTPRQSRLMTIIGILDMTAYTCFTIGFTYVGAAISSVILASTAQVFTALATRFVLKKRLSGGQLAAISCVCLGLVLRALPSTMFDSNSSSATKNSTTNASEAEGDLLLGASVITLAGLLYSGLGITYEMLATGPDKPPSHPEVIWNISKLGFTVSTAYQVVYTIPRWESLVAGRAAAGGYSLPYVVILLVCFGSLFNLHMFAQALMFKAEGAIGVGLINAMRGAVITILSGFLFCSVERPYLCTTRQAAVTAAVTTLGGIAWVLSKPSASSSGGGGAKIDKGTRKKGASSSIDTPTRRTTRSRAAAVDDDTSSRKKSL